MGIQLFCRIQIDAMAKTDTILLASKFRGCLMGSLLGDCMGVPFEGDVNISKVVLQQYFDKLSGPYFKAPIKPYSDDTAMTKCLANSLVVNKGFDPHDLAKRFVVEYFKDPRRGYGENVTQVFFKLRTQKFADPFGPAKAQFDGSGSLGNGGAMRVAPIALFYHHDYVELVEKARLSAEITHTNKLGVNGAILQAIAVHQSLHSDPKENLDVTSFSNQLIEKMSAIEKDEDGKWPAEHEAFKQCMNMISDKDHSSQMKFPICHEVLGLDDPPQYQVQLKNVQRLLGMEGKVPDEEVQNVLGTSVAALYSVPTAIFCFLKAQQDIPNIETENPFQRTIQYAISLGGDTDTIACMAGAIAGAFYGYSVINESLQKHCESAADVVRISEELYNVSSS